MRDNLAEARQLRDEISSLQTRVSKARTRAADYLDEKALALVAAEQQRMAHSWIKPNNRLRTYTSILRWKTSGRLPDESSVYASVVARCNPDICSSRWERSGPGIVPCGTRPGWRNLGDMRPVFLKFESRPLPAISPKEVARRYQKLFEKSDEPEVRIDALNRLNNIRDRSGQDIGFSDEQQSAVYEEALASYESILARGSFSGKLDELLYQMAKAHALTGQHEESIQRLRQLVGLYPRSSLVPEARFRIAEAAYNAGEYQEAETGYRQLIEGDGHQDLAMKARYMLGWSQFKQGPAAWNRSAETFMALLDQHLPSEATLLDPPHTGLDMIEDSFRVLALMAARADNSATLAAWLGNRAPVAWPHLLYDRLADLHALEGRFDLAVGINQAFAGNYSEHSAAPDFLAQSVDYWRMAGDTSKAREARADYVARFQSQPKFQELRGQQQALWRDYARLWGLPLCRTGLDQCGWLL